MANTQGKCHICLVSLYLHPLLFGMQTIFALNSPLSIYILFATYLQGANLCTSIFSSSEFHLDKPEKSCSRHSRTICARKSYKTKLTIKKLQIICSGYLNQLQCTYRCTYSTFCRKCFYLLSKLILLKSYQECSYFQSIYLCSTNLCDSVLYKKVDANLSLWMKYIQCIM